VPPAPTFAVELAGSGQPDNLVQAFAYLRQQDIRQLSELHMGSLAARGY
jgi:hypothetical protein